jgi:hypothetical protein
VRDAQLGGRAALFRTFFRELLALPALWMHARRRDRDTSEHVQRRRLIMTELDPIAAPSGRSSWRAALATALLLVTFPAAWRLAHFPRLLLAGGRLDFLYRLLWTDVIRYAVSPAIFYLVLLGGLLVAWRKDFPRWSYPYVGWLLVFLVFGFGVSGFDDPYLYRIWGPLLVTLLLAVLLRPSAEPLRALYHGWRGDWSLSCFAMLGPLEFMVIAGYDEMPGPRVLFESLSAALLVLGALAYLRARRRAGRVAGLILGGGLGSALTMSALSYYWGRARPPRVDAPFNALADFVRGLLPWALWMAVLMAPALLSLVVKRLSRGSPAG